MSASMMERPDVIPSAVHLIGGDLRSDGAGGECAHVNPATGEVQAKFALAGPSDVDAAVTAAQRAFPAWRDLAANQRRKLMLRLAGLLTERVESLATLATLENGTPMAFTPIVASAFPADYFEYYAGWVDKIEGAVIPVYPGAQFDYTLPEPYGVIGVIIPWNAPLFSIGMKVAPALAAGNCIVLKPPELAPFTAVRFGELCLEAGFPPGVVNVVVGGPEAGDALVGHRGVGKVSFTGSASTARAVVARTTESLKPVVLELGGKSANIVFADADLDYATAIAAQVPITTMSGQGCNLPTRLIVEAPVYDEMVTRVSTIAATFKVGDPFAPDTMMGPVISGGACQRIQGIIDEAVAGGSGRLVTGGHRLGGDLGGGFFLEPTVFADVDPASPLAQKEIFGPVLSIIRADDEDDAVRLANDVEYGLAAYVWTRDLRRAHRVARRVEAGYVGINGYPLLPPNAPFGGKKGSGYGREGGKAGLEEFISVKNVYVEMEPPFGG